LTEASISFADPGTILRSLSPTLQITFADALYASPVPVPLPPLSKLSPTRSSSFLFSSSIDSIRRHQVLGLRLQQPGRFRRVALELEPVGYAADPSGPRCGAARCLPGPPAYMSLATHRRTVQFVSVAAAEGAEAPVAIKQLL